MKTETATEIDVQNFANALEKAQINFTPAFVHGLLTAYCCQATQSHAWATTLVEEIDSLDAIQATQLRYLNQVKNVIATQLADSELSFQLLLNNTAETLHDEVLLTREWVSGYWLGAQESDLSSKVSTDDLSSEFLEDLPQLAAMPLPDEEAIDNASMIDEYADNYDDSDDVYDQDVGDDTRADIVEIQEYCRAGAIGVFLAAWKA